MNVFATLESNPDDHCTYTFGIISCGVETWSGIWSKGTPIFTYNSRIHSDKSNHHIHYYHTDWDQYLKIDLSVVQDEIHQTFNQRWIADWCCPSKARHLLISTSSQP